MNWPSSATATKSFAAWVVAFAIVTTLITLFPLGALPPMLRALVISGILVALMVNVVMPAPALRIARRARS